MQIKQVEKSYLQFVHQNYFYFWHPVETLLHQSTSKKCRKNQKQIATSNSTFNELLLREFGLIRFSS